MTNAVPQFINLFQRDTGWKSRVLRGRNAGLGIFAMVLGLGALAWYSSWRVARLETLAASVTSEYESRSAGLAAAGSMYSTRDDYKALQRRVAGLVELSARQDVVLGRMNSVGLGSREGFTRQLNAVAAAAVDGVWLTRIELATSPARFQLSGIAMSPDLLPQYLTVLGTQPGLGVKRLQTLTLDDNVADARAAAAGAVAFNVLQIESDKAEVL
jgi:Tfp pilus assembly protein PilN